MHCTPPPLSGCKPAKASEHSSLANLVSSYRIHNRPSALAQKEFFQSRSTFREALHHASLAIDGRFKRYGHQRRIPISTLKQAQTVLESNSDGIKCAKSFFELHQLFESTVLLIRGIGDLYVYDTALRLGAHLGLKPEHVYLHAGTLAGARALGIRFASNILLVSEFPEPIQSLDPDEIEDFLCIYKGLLTR